MSVRRAQSSDCFADEAQRDCAVVKDLGSHRAARHFVSPALRTGLTKCRPWSASYQDAVGAGGRPVSYFSSSLNMCSSMRSGPQGCT